MTTVAAVKEIGSTIELNVANISRNRCLCIWLCVFLEGEEGERGGGGVSGERAITAKPCTSNRC